MCCLCSSCKPILFFCGGAIIRCLEPLIGDLLLNDLQICHFDEQVFLSLGGEKIKTNERREITWYASSLSHLDSRTNQSGLEVQKIIHLQDIANQIPDAFSDSR